MTVQTTEELEIELEENSSHIDLSPNKSYTLSEELTVPENTTIEGNGSVIQPDGDYNGLFLEDDIRLSNLWVSVGHLDEYDSKALEINTERYGSYHGAGGGIDLDGVFVVGSSETMGGDGLYIRVGSKQWYSANQFHKFGASGMENGLHADVSDSGGGGHANANRFHALLWNNGTQIRHSGNGPFESVITGELDATSRGKGTDHMIVNEPSTQRTCHFNGKIYDPFNCNDEPLVGMMNIKHHGRPHPYLLDNSPNAGGLLQSQDRDEVFYADLADQTTYRQRFVGGWWRQQYDPEGGRNFRDATSIRSDDNQYRVHPELVTNDMWVTGELTHNLDMGNKQIEDHAEGEPESNPQKGPADGFLEIETDDGNRYVPYYQ